MPMQLLSGITGALVMLQAHIPRCFHILGATSEIYDKDHHQQSNACWALQCKVCTCLGLVGAVYVVAI